MTHGLERLEILDNGKPTGIVMFETPSPASILFTLPKGSAVQLKNTVSFAKGQDAMHACPVAYHLLMQRDESKRAIVTQVSVGNHPTAVGRACVTVTLADPAGWRTPARLLLVQRKILEAVKSGRPVVNAAAIEGEKELPELKSMFMAAGDKPDIAELKAVIHIFNGVVVGTHGGTLTYAGYDPAAKRLDVYSDGACTTCGATQSTLNGLQRQLQRARAQGIIARDVASVRIVANRLN